MNLIEAKEECQRWLAHLDRQKAKAAEMQRIAAGRRDGTVTWQQAQRRLRALDSGVTVYDGARLAEAVMLLLKRIDGQ